MPALFTRSSDVRFRLVLGAILIAAIGTPSFLLVWFRMPQGTNQFQPIEQPVMFDHRHHVLDDGLDCRYCHGAAERSPYAGVPSTALCMGCHGQIWNSSAQTDPLRVSAWTGVPIRWNRIHRLPDFVYFNHAIHVNKGIGCVTCHGRVDQMAAVFQVKPLTMGWCLDCHRAPERYLRPPERIADMAWERDPADKALEERLVRLYQPRHLTHCTTCHR
jgi:hypothetical protein